MDLTKIEIGAGGFGTLLSLGSFLMNTAPEGTHNIGLLQNQLMTLQLGGILVVTGTMIALAGIVISRIGAADTNSLG